MDVGVITDEVSQDISEALEVMKRCDVRVSEIRAVWGKNSIDLDQEELRTLKAALNNAGSSVCAVASPFFKCDLTDFTAAERGRLHEAKDLTLADQMDVLDRACRVADVLGTRNIRVFSFWRSSDPTPEIEARIVELFQEPLAKAKERGVRLLLENEHSCFQGTGEETARLLRQFDNGALAAVWDPGNAFCAGEVPFPDGYTAIRPWIAHVHVKDAVRDERGEVRFVKVGQGQVDYVGQVAQLKADGYDGVLSLETHYSKEVGGKAAASEESLRSLAAMVRGV
ncbi:MAG: sugar phosphate isomerase/epimerase [Armatimonadetes bacterium]|nr:sugar phosphate isomerase/epimerase [Armatimonadota bacterium]